MNSFLFFANLVQQFDIKRVPGSKATSAEAIVDFGRSPKQFKVPFVPRSS
jgi:hypothetical protein